MSKFKTILKYATAVAGALAAFGIAALYANQEKLIYFPVVQGSPRSPKNNPPGYRNPESVGLNNFQNVEIKTVDKVLIRGWLIKTSEPKKTKTLVFFHENAGNIGSRLYFIRELVNRLQVNVLIVAYRGYSDSEGVPSQAGIKKDGVAILDYALRSQSIDTDQIYLFGRSLGGAVAAFVAGQDIYRNAVQGVILETTFTSMEDMVVSVLGKIGYIIKPLLRNKWETLSEIANIDAPILFIKAEYDELVPIAQMNKLEQTARNFERNCLSYTILGGNHNETWTCNPEQYFNELKKFINVKL